MKQRFVSARIAPRAVVTGEVVAGLVALALSATLDSWPIAVASGAATGLVICVLTFRERTVWQWAWRAMSWTRRRVRRLQLPQPVDVTLNEHTVGVVIDGHTVSTMITVLGKPYIPTLLHADHTKTLNTVPISVIAQEMQRCGLSVDVDIICEGSRTARDNYAELYEAALRAAGGRSA